MQFVAITLGLGLVGLVVFQLGVYVYTTLGQLSREERHNQLTDTLLKERIAAAEALRLSAEQDALTWQGYRKFVVDRKEMEADGICSFYLKPHDGKPIPSYRPGQYLEFRLDIPGVDYEVIRCYSLSDASCGEHYRVTIKRGYGESRDPRAPGDSKPLSSNFFHDEVQQGDILDVKAPSGRFVLLENKRPAVFIAGGVGITPMLSMVNHEIKNGSDRDMVFFVGMRHGGEHPMKDYVRNLAKKHDNLTVVYVYSGPKEGEKEGTDFDHHAQISVDLMKPYLARKHHQTGELVESNNYDFYICGPPPMMSALTDQLKAWNVPKNQVLSEAFGPASVPAKATAAGAMIKFSKSSQEMVWDGKSASILTMATKQGIKLPHACCVGKCGQCELALRSGKVDYGESEPEWPVKDGCCLTCIARPDGDVTLDH